MTDDSKLPSKEITDWLMSGDASIRWQTLRDVVGAPENKIHQQQSRIAREGWGARLLALQDSNGKWASGASPESGLYTPKWTSTTYTMLLLRDLGLPPTHKQAKLACRQLLENGVQKDGGINYGMSAIRMGRSETCITGMVLSILSYFEYNDRRLDTIADNLLQNQMSDGGWNCRSMRGSTHSSVHTTISVLEALHHYEVHRGGKLLEIGRSQVKGREFLLRHRLFRSHRTGKVIKPEFLRFSFPPRWHYDILRALDYFQAVNAARDQRLKDAIDIVQGKQCGDGRWLHEYSYKGKTHFELERIGHPSRWNTLRALRVLRWFQT